MTDTPGVPLANAKLDDRHPGGPGLGPVATTDASGDCTIGNLPAGRYVVSAAWPAQRPDRQDRDVTVTRRG